MLSFIEKDKHNFLVFHNLKVANIYIYNFNQN